MDVLASRVLLHPRDLERSLRFYEQTLGLAVFREWGSGGHRGVVFYAGGGLLEVSGSRALGWNSGRSARSTGISTKAKLVMF